MGLFSSTSELDPELLASAAHELGHAVAWKKARVPIKGIYVYRSGAGHCRCKTMELTDKKRAQIYLSGLLAGHEAEDLWRRKNHLGRADKARSGADFDAFHRLQREWDIVSVSKARSMARSIVRSRWGQIQRLAPKLATRGHLGSI